MNTLELQARLLKDQLEFNTAKYQEAVARESAASAPADARVISRADPPQLPSFPKKLPVIAIMTLAGLALSVGMLIAREVLSGRAFVVDQVETALPQQVELMPAVGAVPAPASEAVVVKTPAAPLPATRDSEPNVVAVLRELRSSRQTTLATRILVTALSAQGETAAAAVTLARQLAIEARTILVDFNRGAPALKNLPVAPATSDREDQDLSGLSELLSGDATFAEIIHRDGLSRLHVIPTGKGDLPEDEHSGFGLVLDALAETYDYVLMHAPSPHHTVTRILSADTDATVLLRAEGTPEADVQAARADLEERGTAPVYTISASTLAAAGLVRDAA